MRRHEERKSKSKRARERESERARERESERAREPESKRAGEKESQRARERGKEKEPVIRLVWARGKERERRNPSFVVCGHVATENERVKERE
jgi:RNA-binding motif X-linked protein 2